ncbi:MAG: 2,3-bisphosphoglycerate-independent phosphoglycerate mutase [Paracoccaceae bacterium]
MSAPKPVVLCILDGWGLSDTMTGNAPAQAHTPVMDTILADQPNATLITHGPDAGLPRGQMGNSEVGHMNIGAGRVVAMDLGKIDMAIEDGSLASKPALIELIKTLQQTGGRAHVMGLCSTGGVHSHQAHMVAVTEALVAAGVPVQIHAITDGRDVAPRSADRFIPDLIDALPSEATIGTVIGRYFAMDRDNRWDRVQQSFDLVVNGKGAEGTEAAAAVQDGYQRDESDEFLSATVLDAYTAPKDGDGLLFINFRSDRAREILAALADPEFDAFDTGLRPQWSTVCGMVEYSDRHNTYMSTIFPSEDIRNTLGEWVAAQGKTQFRLAETEKYPHVTFFLNGGEETPSTGEDRYMPKSPNVATYDLQPEMSSVEVTDRFVAAIKAGYDLIVTNYANPDMVGHTGDLQAAIAACEAVDTGLGRVLDALHAAGGAMIVTADHGNCEVMIDLDTGGPHTAHTLNPVPVALIGGPDGAQLQDGRLADLAPTVLQLMGLPQPAEMTGESLIR